MLYTHTERINSIFKDGDTGVYSSVSPNPKQTPSFRMEYKSEGFGDFHNYNFGKKTESSMRGTFLSFLMKLVSFLHLRSSYEGFTNRIFLTKIFKEYITETDKYLNS